METKQTLKTRDLAEMALFLAIICILAFTPLGYIPIGPVNATTMHIPVIIAGIVLGPKKGAIIGFLFGTTSFLRASFFAPTITSFLFSPLYPGGNFFSLVICFVPRILLGVISYYIFKGMMKASKNKTVSCAVAATLTSVLHTAMVLGLSGLVFGDKYLEAIGEMGSILAKVIFAAVYTNGIPEAIVAGILCTAVCTAMFKIRRTA